MSMVCGLDLHRQQITFDALDSVSGRCGEAGYGDPTGNGSAVGCEATSPGGRTGSRWHWRWRAAPVGGTWPRRYSPPGSRCTWPSRPIRRRRGARSTAPRRTGPTPSPFGGQGPPCPPTGPPRRPRTAVKGRSEAESRTIPAVSEAAPARSRDCSAALDGCPGTPYRDTRPDTRDPTTRRSSRNTSILPTRQTRRCHPHPSRGPAHRLLPSGRNAVDPVIMAAV
jgi:hypothetical protein